MNIIEFSMRFYLFKWEADKKFKSFLSKKDQISSYYNEDKVWNDLFIYNIFLLETTQVLH